MIVKNNKITALQIAFICFFISSSLFQGVSEVFLYESAKQNAWLAVLVSALIGLIPLLLIIYIMNYEPDKNIIDKINHLFGKIGGSIINALLTTCTFILLIFTIWLLTNFTEIKYLIGTPPLFVGILFFIPIIYSTYKGIETIARSSEILFYITIIFNIIIAISLLSYMKIGNIFPLLNDGLFPLLKSSLQFLFYTVPALLLLTIIPKNNIINKEKLSKYIIFGYIGSTLLLTYVTFTVINIIGADLADIYRFPSYYVMKKIKITGFLENSENIFSLLWIFNMYISICVYLYYLSIYFKQNFKIKKYNITLLIIIAIITLKIRDYFLFSSVITMSLAKSFFPYVISLTMFLITLITAIIIKLKSFKKRPVQT